MERDDGNIHAGELRGARRLEGRLIGGQHVTACGIDFDPSADGCPRWMSPGPGVTCPECRTELTRRGVRIEYPVTAENEFDVRGRYTELELDDANDEPPSLAERAAWGDVDPIEEALCRHLGSNTIPEAFGRVRDWLDEVVADVDANAKDAAALGRVITNARSWAAELSGRISDALREARIEEGKR